MSAVTRDNKSSSFAPANQRFAEPHNGSDQRGLRLQLENELDKLALLIQQVREQSARVQAAADAIGDRMLMDTSDRPPSTNLQGNNRAVKLPSIIGQSSL